MFTKPVWSKGDQTKFTQTVLILHIFLLTKWSDFLETYQNIFYNNYIQRIISWKPFAWWNQFVLHRARRDSVLEFTFIKLIIILFIKTLPYYLGNRPNSLTLFVKMWNVRIWEMFEILLNILWEHLKLKYSTDSTTRMP